ncbi:MAG: tRNA lysidine(34) synthetase TilS [Opitutae bacterium]|nr:tRNA lysidine(34) synthetase TilS [Opitutae bacterium]
MTEQLPSEAELRALSNKLLASFPLERWHGRASRAIKDTGDGKIAVACSGGADSTFALLMIHAAFAQCRESIHVLHFNHRLRPDSDDDENFVAQLAERLDLQCSTYRSAGSLSKKDEGTLRNERLNSFIEFCQRSKTDLMIQGHNQDDVAETIIWRLSRGSSPQGLCAPRPVHKHGEVHIVRPFITINREDIRSSLAEVKMPWREDCTNQSSAYLRNRIRMNGLRLLKDDVDRDLLGGMSRSRDLLEEQEDAVDEWAKRAQIDCIKDGGIDAIELSKVPVAIRRRIIYDWLSGESIAAAITSNQMEEILECIDSGGKLNLSISPNAKIGRRKGLLVLENDKPKASGWPLCAFPQNQPLYLPDKNFIRFTTLKTTPDLISRILSGQVDASREAFFATQGSPPLVFFARTRHPGDAYRPIGAPGKKKVKNWMIDRKLDSANRDSIPLIMNSAGEIIWIPGLPPAESHRVQGSEKMVIHLTYGHSATLL